MTKLQRVRFWLFLALIIGAPLSKYPNFALPAFNFTSFRIGLYQILAAIFVLLCLKLIITSLNELYKQNRIAFISLNLLAVTTVFGLLFAFNKPRSLLLAVSILFLISLVFAAWRFVKTLKPKHFDKLLSVTAISAIFYGTLALIEFGLATFYDSNLGMLCQGCLSDVFGFPRINLFTAEPQFLANSLFPFLFIAVFKLIKTNRRIYLLSVFLTALAISLTFSRGAYLALFVSFSVFVLVSLFCKAAILKKLVISGLIILLAMSAGFGLLVGSAAYRYRSTPDIAYNTASSILEHASLGLFRLPEKSITQPASQTNTTDEPFVSPGLIESSTDDRLGASELALKAWASDARTMVFGVGAGNLGPFVVEKIEPAAPNNLTVYIFYVLILAELGIIGLASFLILKAAAILNLLKLIKITREKLLVALLLSIIVSFIVQYAFFGTFINTVYIWLWTGLLLGLNIKNIDQVSKNSAV